MKVGSCPHNAGDRFFQLGGWVPLSRRSVARKVHCRWVTTGPQVASASATVTAALIGNPPHSPSTICHGKIETTTGTWRKLPGPCPHRLGATLQVLTAHNAPNLKPLPFPTGNFKLDGPPVPRSIGHWQGPVGHGRAEQSRPEGT